MWGEVILELKNAHTGEVEKTVRGHNTLMKRFIDSLLGGVGHAPGYQINTVSDIRQNYYINTTAGIGGGGSAYFNMPESNYRPEVLVLGNDSTAITNTDANLNGIIATSDRNLYSSKEGGTGQTSRDNIYLKLSRTYNANEMNVTIKNIGLYSTRLSVRAHQFTGASTYTFPANNEIWEVLGLYYTDIGSDFINIERRDDSGVNGFIWDRTTQTVTSGSGFAAGTPVIMPVIKDVVNTVYVRGEYLAGIVLPETIVKNANQTLSVIWLIHFDAA